MTKKPIPTILLIALALLFLAACAPAAPVTLPPTAIGSAIAAPQTTSREAQVQSVEVQTSQSDPLQVSVVVHGNLTESCATLGESQVQYTSNAI
jgi:predicted small lipoprotein YifL